MLGEALVQVERDADVIAVVFKFENIDDGEDDDGFKVHLLKRMDLNVENLTQTR